MNHDKQARREELYALLGDLPDRDYPISATLTGEEEREGYVLEKLVLDLNGTERVPAYFVRPKDATGPLPCVLYNHAHGHDYVLGKDELLSGRAALQDPPYAEAFTAAGYSALCIDTWAFGERRGRTESEIFKEMLWNGQVMWGMMVYDSLRAIDYLASREDVDSSRLATLGISMGSTMAWWTAALDDRIKVCIDICCMTDFQALVDSRGLDGHGIYYYVPRLLRHFTTVQINALIAPRPHLSLNGAYDSTTPLAGLHRVDEELRAVYEAENASDAWKSVISPSGHFETAEMRAEIFLYMRKWL